MTSLWNFDYTTVWSIGIIGGEIFTIELQPGSEGRDDIDSGQTECELNWQLHNVCKGEQATNISKYVDAVKVSRIRILLNSVNN